MIKKDKMMQVEFLGNGFIYVLNKYVKKILDYYNFAKLKILFTNLLLIKL
jgi:hypothetical protein